MDQRAVNRIATIRQRLLRRRGIGGWLLLVWAAIGIWSNADFLATRNWNSIIEDVLRVVLSRWFGLLALAGGIAWLFIVATRSEPSRQVSRDVVLMSPLPGSTVSRPFFVEGLAGTFERNVVIERRAADGSWEQVGNPGIAGQEDDGYGLSPRFRMEVNLPQGRHRLRVGDYDAAEGNWDGVEFDVRVV